MVVTSLSSRRSDAERLRRSLLAALLSGLLGALVAALAGVVAGSFAGAGAVLLSAAAFGALSGLLIATFHAWR